jgi:2-phosphosulfolactate phosphatase
MKVFIQPANGPELTAQDSRIVAVVIDALRASVTIAAALECGAREVIPVVELAEARGFQGRPGFLTAGERGGEKIQDLDFGNSPSQLADNRDRLNGAVLVLTTSNGTRTIQRAAGAGTVLVGSLPNLTAVAARAFNLAKAKKAGLSLFPAGRSGGEAEEDLYVAGRIGLALAGMGAEFIPSAGLERLLRLEPAEVFLGSESGQRLSRLGYRKDVLLCAGLDSLPVVPILRGRSLVRGN